jgi:hypothetical protein
MFILNGTLTIKPNEAKESPDAGSSFTRNLNNGRRRAMRNIKYDWDITLNRATLSEYNDIKTIFETGTAVTFVNNDLGLNTTVYLDIVDHGYIAGSGTYRSNVGIHLTEV